MLTVRIVAPEAKAEARSRPSSALSSSFAVLGGEEF